MEDAVADVLKAIGWDSGFRLPIANEENQALEKELARLVIKKSAKAKEYDEISARCKSLQDHLKYMRQEVEQNQSLLAAYHQQLDNENHRLKLKQAEKDNTVAETRRLAKSTESIQSRLASKKLQLARNLVKLEKMKTEAEWDSQAMKAWEESIKKRDSDNELLKKFSDEDKKKLSALEAKRKNLQNEIHTRKDMLAQMDVDINNYEQVMRRTGKMLTSLKEEREALVNQWQESVKNLRQKDTDIKRTHNTINELQETLKQKREEMEEKEAFLASEKNNNKYIQMEIKESNITNFRKRKEYHAAIQENAKYTNEHIGKKKLVQRNARDLAKIQSNLKQSSKLKQHYLQRIQELKEDMKSFHVQDLIITEQNTNANKNADILDKMIKESDRSYLYLTQQMQSLLNKQYKLNISTSELSTSTHARKAEACALENSLEQIRKRKATEEQKLIRKKQYLSDLQMKVACIEAQLGNIDPDEIEDFQEMWRLKIADLEETIKQHTEIKNLLHGQILKLQKENLRLVNSMATDGSLHQVMKDKLQSLCLQIEGGIKQSKAATLRTQQLQVSENLMQLKLDKLQTALNDTDEEIYNSQRYKIDLESTLKERLIEVNAAKDVLFAKKKNLDEERSRLKCDITNRCHKIQQLENKYNLSLGLLGKDENGETMSVSAFKVKTAEEKYELQQEGDELDKKIRKAEQEIVAMENTLKLVNMTNKSFKDSLTFVDEESQDARELREVEDSLVVKLAELKEKRHDLYVQIDKEKDLKMELEQAKKMTNVTKEELENLEGIITKYIHEQQERDEKIERATRHLALCVKKIDKQQIEKYDRELYIRQLQDTNKTVMYQLADFSVEHPETVPVLRNKFERQELELPQQRTSLGSVSSASINSYPGTPSTPSTPSSWSSSEYTNKKLAAKVVAPKPERQNVNVTQLQLSFDLSATGPQSTTSSPSGVNVSGQRKDKKNSMARRK